MSDLVVFACADNAGRSQIAATLFNAAVDPARAHAIAAGARPAACVHPTVVETMREIGFDLRHVRPDALTPTLVAGARWLVTMGGGTRWLGLPGAWHMDWPVDDIFGGSVERVRQVRDDIARLVWTFVLNEWEEHDYSAREIVATRRR